MSAPVLPGRRLLASAAAALVLSPLHAQRTVAPLPTRAVPSTRQAIPV